MNVSILPNLLARIAFVPPYQGIMTDRRRGALLLLFSLVRSLEPFCPQWLCCGASLALALRSVLILRILKCPGNDRRNIQEKSVDVTL